MQVHTVTGDLIEMLRLGKIDAAVHGCNCFHTMGSGIAPKLNELSGNRLLMADRQTPYGDINKLGTFSSANFRLTQSSPTVHNAYTQFNYGSSDGGEVYVHWRSFYRALFGIVIDAGDRGVKTIGVPLIGCGLAGGQRADFDYWVKTVVYDLPHVDVTLYIVEY